MSEYGGLYIVRPSSFTNVEWLELYALSAVEVNQAMRLRSVHARAAYVACRLLLRALVSTYAQVPVDQIEIGQGEYGKPVVTYPTGKCVEFNISHSHPVSVLAMAPAVPIGVDIVEVAEVPEGRGFARRVVCITGQQESRMAGAGVGSKGVVFEVDRCGSESRSKDRGCVLVGRYEFQGRRRERSISRSVR